ncbi:LysR substrate-binding domain-containing protein, partial [Pseudomonas viridiflava]|uniref:LysR substrate-binding domain-containing protein n=1 Tax=Pseudomonas viridiflava TaxID=33069 RepID=UPI001F11B413
QEAGEPMTMIGLVAAGLGVTVLPAPYRRMRIDGVVYRNPLDPGATSPVWLVKRKDEQSAVARAFFELATKG